MNFNLDNKDFINNEFQNLIFKIKSLANDINQNNDKMQIFHSYKIF